MPIRWTDPNTWPWVFYVWIAIALIGSGKPLWRWQQKRRARDWPVADGTIESVDVSESSSFFAPKQRGRPASFKASLSYSYNVNGQMLSGRFDQDFGDAEEAKEFVRDLQGRAAIVAYNPDTPAHSTLRKESLDSLTSVRPEVQRSFHPVAALPRWMKRLIRPLVLIAAVGLIISIWVHFGTLLGRRGIPDLCFVLMHVGIFLVFVPSVFVAQRLVGHTGRKDFWRAVLRWAPDWMRYSVYGFSGYAVINFLLFIPQAPPHGGTGSPPLVVLRMFSGHWMAFYSASLAILYSAVNSPEM